MKLSFRINGFNLGGYYSGYKDNSSYSSMGV